MTVGGDGAGWSINDQIAASNNRRVLGSKFNYALNDVNSGSKVNEPLISFSNPKTGENIEILDSGSTTESKGSKIKIVIPILATLIVLLLMCGGVFFFINKVFNANYFLEESSKSVSSFAKKVLNEMDINNEYLSDLDKYDVVSNTNIKLSSSTSALENLNGITLNLDVNARVKEKYVSMDATLKQDSENIKASAVINNDKVYVESKEFFDKMVSIDSSVKVEDIISEYFNTIGNYDILEIVNKYIS